MKLISCAIGLVLCVLLLFSCEQKQAPIQPSGKVIKIGVMIPKQEDLPNGRSEGLIGINMANKHQPYLYNGDEIVLLVERIPDKHKQTADILKKLLLTEQVSAVLMFAKSDLVLAVSALADLYKTPLIALTATHPDVTRDRHYVNQLVFDDRFQGAVAALFVRDELLIRKAAVIRDRNSISSEFLATEFIKQFSSVNGVITDIIDFSVLSDNAMDAVQAIQEHKPELLYMPMTFDKVSVIARQLKKRNWQPLLMGADGLISQALQQQGEQLVLLEGLMATDFFSSEMSLSSFGREIFDRYSFRNDKAFTGYAPLGAEGYAYLIDAMNRCLSPTDRECINHKLRSSSGFFGIIGKISLDLEGKAMRPLVINKIKEGEMQFMIKVY